MTNIMEQTSSGDKDTSKNDTSQNKTSSQDATFSFNITISKSKTMEKVNFKRDSHDFLLNNFPNFCFNTSLNNESQFSGENSGEKCSTDSDRLNLSSKTLTNDTNMTNISDFS